MKSQSLRFCVSCEELFMFLKRVNCHETKQQYVSDKKEGDQKMNLHFIFSIREISEVRDSDQVLKIPMYFNVEWEVEIILSLSATKY